jgi:glycosyltransferase involved in cell wall biosynthesis
MSTPLVSACLLTYKRAAVLPRTLTDLLGQSFGDIELIINDDNSPDETEAVCREFERRDPRVRYHKNPRNLRYAGNQNAAVQRATGKYVAFLHDGDRYAPQLLERWVDALERHPSAGLVFNAVNLLGRDGTVRGGHDHGYPELMRGGDLYDAMLGSLGSPIFGIVMVRRDALLAAGRFDESLPVLADVDMWFRILANHDVAYVPDRLYSIYPREEDHPNARVNWQIRNELSRIYRAACDRRHPRGTTAWRAAHARLSRLLLRADLRGLASSLVRGRWRLFCEGVPQVASRSLAAWGYR